MDYHFSVLSNETIKLLDVTPNQVYIDATLGNGGHTLEILKKGGIVYGIDLDPNNLKIATERIEKEGFKDHFFPVHSNFVDIKKISKDIIKNKVDGIIFDLGLSRNQQKSQQRGFSFDDTESLDMRLDPKLQTTTAEEIINIAPFEELYEIFSKYGQEIYTKPLILRIIRERQKSPIKTGQRLANIVREYYQKHHFKSKIDPSTKIFLSLRIAVNDEFENLKKALATTLDIVKSNGRVCVISFHSGEDRIVKQFIKDQKRNNKIVGLTSKGVQPKFEEIKINPLSRSAILRSFKIV